VCKKKRVVDVNKLKKCWTRQSPDISNNPEIASVASLPRNDNFKDAISIFNSPVVSTRCGTLFSRFLPVFYSFFYQKDNNN